MAATSCRNGVAPPVANRSVPLPGELHAQTGSECLPGRPSQSAKNRSFLPEAGLLKSTDLDGIRDPAARLIPHRPRTPQDYEHSFPDQPP